jgi:hypothetical protein
LEGIPRVHSSEVGALPLEGRIGVWKPEVNAASLNKKVDHFELLGSILNLEGFGHSLEEAEIPFLLKSYGRKNDDGTLVSV